MDKICLNSFHFYLVILYYTIGKILIIRVHDKCIQVKRFIFYVKFYHACLYLNFDLHDVSMKKLIIMVIAHHNIQA